MGDWFSLIMIKDSDTTVQCFRTEFIYRRYKTNNMVGLSGFRAQDLNVLIHSP